MDREAEPDLARGVRLRAPRRTPRRIVSWTWRAALGAAVIGLVAWIVVVAPYWGAEDVPQWVTVLGEIALAVYGVGLLVGVPTAVVALVLAVGDRLRARRDRSSEGDRVR